MKLTKPLVFVRRGARWVGQNLSAKQTELHLNIIVSLAIRLIGLVLMVFACLLIWRLAQNNDYSLEAFSVPKSIEEQGYDGAFLAVKMQDQLARLKQLSGSSKTDSLHIGNGADTDFDVSVMGLDLSIKSIAHQIRLLFGRPVKTINGALSRSGSSLHLNLRVSGFTPVDISAPFSEDNPNASIDVICKKSAEALLGMTDPYRLAIVCYREKRHAEGIDLVRKIIKERPHERIWAYIAWGAILEDLGELDLSASKFKRASELDPGFFLAWTRWGTVLGKQRKFTEAIEKFEQSAALKPDQPGIMYYIAWLSFYTGQREKCHEFIQKALQYGQSKDANMWKMCAEFKMGQDSFAAAEKMYQRCIELSGETAVGYIARSSLAFIKKDTDAVIQYGIYSSELDPGDLTGPKMALGMSFYKRDFAKAIEIASNINIAKADKADQMLLYNQLSVAYNFLNKPDSAISYIKKSIAIDSTIGYPYSTYAEIYGIRGDSKRFYALFEKALQHGMPVGAIDFSFEPYKSMQHEPRFKKLLEVYGAKSSLR